MAEAFESFYGSGYPLGLVGAEIPLLARIFAVVDAFDALISNRHYRESISRQIALDYMRSQAGILFDPEIISVFTHLNDAGRLDSTLSSI